LKPNIAGPPSDAYCLGEEDLVRYTATPILQLEKPIDAQESLDSVEERDSQAGPAEHD